LGGGVAVVVAVVVKRLWRGYWYRPSGL
jgi:hypothetical protein